MIKKQVAREHFVMHITVLTVVTLFVVPIVVGAPGIPPDCGGALRVTAKPGSLGQYKYPQFEVQTDHAEKHSSKRACSRGAPTD